MVVVRNDLLIEYNGFTKEVAQRICVNLNDIKLLQNVASDDLEDEQLGPVINSVHNST